LREELDYDEIAAIFLEYGKVPKMIPQDTQSSPPPAPVVSVEPIPPVLVAQPPKAGA